MYQDILNCFAMMSYTGPKIKELFDWYGKFLLNLTKDTKKCAKIRLQRVFIFAQSYIYYLVKINQLQEQKDTIEQLLKNTLAWIDKGILPLNYSIKKKMIQTLRQLAIAGQTESYLFDYCKRNTAKVFSGCQPEDQKQLMNVRISMKLINNLDFYDIIGLNSNNKKD